MIETDSDDISKSLVQFDRPPILTVVRAKHDYLHLAPGTARDKQLISLTSVHRNEAPLRTKPEHAILPMSEATHADGFYFMSQIATDRSQRRFPDLSKTRRHCVGTRQKASVDVAVVAQRCIAGWDEWALRPGSPLGGPCE